MQTLANYRHPSESWVLLVTARALAARDSGFRRDDVWGAKRCAAYFPRRLRWLSRSSTALSAPSGISPRRRATS